MISLDIRDSFTIDRQIDGDLISKVRGSLHDQVSTVVAGARLGLRAADEEGASEDVTAEAGGENESDIYQ